MSPSLLVVVTLSVVLLAGGTVLWQEHDLGLANIQHEQLARHRNVLMGRAPNPWRYRVILPFGCFRMASSSRLHSPTTGVSGWMRVGP